MSQPQEHTPSDTISLQQSFERYLEPSGRLEPVTLGDQKPPTPVPVPEKDRRRFERELRTIGARQRSVFKLCLLAVLLLLFIQIGILISSTVSSKPAALLVSGCALGILPVIWALRQLWLDSIVVDMALWVVRYLPPEAAVETIQLLYLNMVRSGTRKGIAPLSTFEALHEDEPEPSPETEEESEG